MASLRTNLATLSRSAALTAWATLLSGSSGASRHPGAASGPSSSARSGRVVVSTNPALRSPASAGRVPVSGPWLRRLTRRACTTAWRSTSRLTTWWMAQSSPTRRPVSR